jgi:hypothetical protein
VNPLRKNFYVWTRNVHLYLGLFLSPFVLVFGISTVVLNHPALAPAHAAQALTEVTVEVPPGLEKLEGMERVEALKSVMRQAGVSGEIDFVRYMPKENRMIVPVLKPGQETTLDLNLATGRVQVKRRNARLRDALVYLHKSPGQHNAAVRGNWVYTRLWGWLTDATVYMLLLISISGIYLWAVMKAERKIGIVLLGAGALSFAGAIYAIVA